jgi:hypothetical protein
MAHNARLANLSNSHDPAFQLFTTIAIHSALILSRNTSNATLATLSGDTLADPVTL